MTELHTHAEPGSFYLFERQRIWQFSWNFFLSIG